jgi:hypothetical protein
VLVIVGVAVIGACGGPPQVGGTETTLTGPAEATSTTTAPVLVDGDPPKVELQEPGYEKAIPSDDVADHFTFSSDVSPSHTTTYASSGPDETWSMTARVDGELVHYLGTGSSAGEMILSGDNVWILDDNGEWVLDEEMFELPIVVAFPSPDLAYSVAYDVFEDLVFVGWAEKGGDDVAVFKGGPEASANVIAGLGPMPSAEHGGSVELWWSPDGFFSKVIVVMSTAGGDVEMSWTITDVGSTEVEAPK